MNRALKRFDPYSKPKGLVLISLMAVEMVDKTVKNDVNDEMLNFLYSNVDFNDLNESQLIVFADAEQKIDIINKVILH